LELEIRNLELNLSFHSVAPPFIFDSSFCFTIPKTNTMAKKYLFIRAADNAPIYGNTAASIRSAGTYGLDPSADRKTISIIDRLNQDKVIDLNWPIADYLKENALPYANFAELDGAVASFFATADVAITVTAGLTDAQLRATPLPVSQSTQPLPTGAAKELNQPMYVDSNFTLTRPANTTPYSDGDAILDTVGIATQKFAGVAKSAGRGVNFINLVAFTNDTGLAGKTINVVFYKQSPASPIADNASFSYASDNELIRKGTIQLTFGTGILAGVAQLGIDSNGMVNLELCPTATDVYVQVWLPTGYTPSANSTYIIMKASAIQN
jgi:hypothetical protein